MSKKIEEADLGPEDEGYIENDMPTIIERLNSGYVSYVQIHSFINYPFLKKRDIVALRKSEHYQVNDFVLYRVDDFYFLRRIISFENGNYYVCGDHEYEVRILHYEDIIAKGISRERGTKRLSLILKNKKRLYTKAIVKKGKLRIKNHTFYDDQTTLTGVYDKAASSTTSPSPVEESSIKVPEMPLDSRLSLQLQAFQSPEDRLREFEREKHDKEEEKKFEEQSSN